MSLRIRFLLTLGLGGVFFLLITTLLIFDRMESAMVDQLEQQFKVDADYRLRNINRLFEELTNRFQSTSTLPMFRSMRFNQLTLNRAALKNDIRQLELHIHESMKKNIEISQVIYIGNKSQEIFRIEKSGIKDNLSDRSQDKTIQKMLSLKNGEYRITLNDTNNFKQNLIWWIPVYISANRIEGVMGFSVSYDYILNSIRETTINESETICLHDSQNKTLLHSKNKLYCDTENISQWIIKKNIDFPGLSWAVILTTNPESFLITVDEIRATVFNVIFPAIAFLGFIFTTIFTNNIVNAIRSLVNAARTMGCGEKLSLVDLNRKDELGELANEMNRSAKLIERNRKQLEEKNIEIEASGKRNLQAIMDHSPAVIYVKDIEGRYTFINKKYEDIFNVKRGDVADKTDFDIFPKEIAKTFSDNDKKILQAGHAVEIEEVAPMDDGLHNYISIKFPLFNDMGEIYAVCGISTDITDYKQQEDKLRRTQKMDALGKLTGGIAHDYNNMLGIILGYADLLHGGLEDKPKLRKYTNEIQRAGERGAKLTEKLLGFTRKIASDAESININSVLEEDKHMLEKTLTARINIEYDLQEDLWDVYLDSNDLEDAIVNMSINAMHAIGDNGLLTFQTRNKHINEDDAVSLDIEAGNYVILNIIDTGCGIDQQALDKIFDPFFTSKGDYGTGLGLSQVYGFVESSKGSIKVYSEEDKGTRFSLYFPQNINPNVENHTYKESDETTNYTGNENILVVDDEAALLGLTSEILSNMGYKVISAHNGEQALELLKNNSIDLIITDVIMPEMDGYQLATRVKQTYPDIKIQLVSGFSDNRHSGMIDDELFENIIHKPFNSHEMLQRVHELLK